MFLVLQSLCLQINIIQWTLIVHKKIMNLHQMVPLRASVKTFENLRNSKKRSEKVKKTAMLKLLTLCPVFQLVEFSNFLNKKGIVGLNFTITIFFLFTTLQMFPPQKVWGIPVSQNTPCNMHINVIGIACMPAIPVISQFR